MMYVLIIACSVLRWAEDRLFLNHNVLLLQQVGQVARLGHGDDDVVPTNELLVNVELGNCGPGAVLLDALAQFWVLKNVKRSKLLGIDSLVAENLDGVSGKSTCWGLGRSLHEQHARGRSDGRIDCLSHLRAQKPHSRSSCSSKSQKHMISEGLPTLIRLNKVPVQAHPQISRSIKSHILDTSDETMVNEKRSAQVARLDRDMAGLPKKPKDLKSRLSQNGGQPNRNNQNNRRRQNRNKPKHADRPTRPAENATPAPAKLSHPPSAISFREDPTFEHIIQVGEGTYGKVYKSRNRATQEVVALKRLRLESEREGLPITAVREIKLLQSLKHPNIVNLTEMVVCGKSIFMAFEYVENDLAGLLLNPALIITPPHIKSLFRQMMEGLEYLHRHAVVHRDIKGSNILLDNAGRIKLADFGLARYVDLDDPNAHYTNRVITLWYRPPELLLGETQYSTEVDIWSMGCLLVELFMRKAIFPGKDEVSELEEIYKILGTPTREYWPEQTALPWYHLIRMDNHEQNHKQILCGLTNNCKSLALDMLQINPKRRLTASKVLAHPYFSEDPKPSPLKLEGEWHDFDAKKTRRREQNSREKEQREKESKDKKS